MAPAAKMKRDPQMSAKITGNNVRPYFLQTLFIPPPTPAAENAIMIAHIGCLPALPTPLP